MEVYQILFLKMMLSKAVATHELKTRGSCRGNLDLQSKEINFLTLFTAKPERGSANKATPG